MYPKQPSAKQNCLHQEEWPYNLIHCTRIADFFAELATLETAYDQTEKLVHDELKPSRAAKAIANCQSYVQVLSANADTLLVDTTRETVVVASYEPQAKIAPLHEVTSIKSELKMPATGGAVRTLVY